MAVAIVGTPQDAKDYTNSAITSLTIGSFVVGACDAILVGIATKGSGSPPTFGVTLGGSATGWAAIGSTYVTSTASGVNSATQWWRLLSPGAGTSALVATFSTGVGFAGVHAICVGGVDVAGTPFGTPAVNTMPSNTVPATFTGSTLTAPTGSMCFNLFNGWGTAATGDCVPTGTSLFVHDNSGARYDVSQYVTTVNPAFSLTAVNNYTDALQAVMSSIVVLPSGGGGGGGGSSRARFSGLLGV